MLFAEDLAASLPPLEGWLPSDEPVGGARGLEAAPYSFLRLESPRW